ncbi:sigma-70 family RNA polymerase sigma factor [Streptomyces endophytica]|uniref:Sigma-70 family RNA polymerase sigma factor n=1 Tax=Streptomyces endophytica TaxID=2991496 RepID=A0ABY6PFY5_9ACTN|nr:sigma-70 family RNA polymerase sigma factor [Streptomyces endophytica]UZJ32691.1 sigma-70 family RNA polymerase sigma factor [Streptomyces endophytica]
MAGKDNGHQNDSSPHQPSRPLTEEQAARIFAGMNEVIRAGEEMRTLRTEMIKMLAGSGWTQEKIAQLTEMSQPAVSKQVTKAKLSGSPPPMDLSLDQRDTPWLEGRLWGLAEEISEACYDTARCTRYVNSLARGRKRFTPQNVDELRRLVEEDLRLHQSLLPGGHREAYDQISRALDVPSKAASRTGAATATPGSPAARRTLASQIQRERLRGDA